MDKIKEIQTELMWALYNGNITQSEYDETINHIDTYKYINNIEKEEAK
jgi:hypothetical protein